MSSREWFCSVRDAVMLIRNYDEKITEETAKLGIRAKSNEEGHRVGWVSDPMFHVLNIVDMESARPKEIKDAVEQIKDALEIVEGLGCVLGKSYADVVRGRFVLGKSWQEVAKENHITKTRAVRLCDISFDYMDAEGMARVKERGHKITNAL